MEFVVLFSVTWLAPVVGAIVLWRRFRRWPPAFQLLGWVLFWGPLAAAWGWHAADRVKDREGRRFVTGIGMVASLLWIIVVWWVMQVLVTESASLLERGP